MYEECRLRARYGECCQFGSMRMWLLDIVCRWACALYNACSRAVVSCSALYSGSASDSSRQAVFLWKISEDCVSRVMRYILLSSQVRGYGVAVYDSFTLEAAA